METSNLIYGQDFYLSIPITSDISEIELKLNSTYYKTDAIFYTTSDSTFKQEQPVVKVNKKVANGYSSITVALPQKRDLDLALRKSITKINNVATTGRTPVVDATNLENKTATTAIYNHDKNDLVAENGQFIEYTITVYNEGQKDGYAAEITDYLPAGIEFESLVTSSTQYTATVSKNSDGTSVVKLINTAKKVLGKYTTGTPASDSVTIRCKVTAETKATSQRLVNIAEITKYYDSESNIEKTSDIDSTVSNFPDSLKNNSYKGNGTEGRYTKGQEDDDDFEAIVVPGKYFDLALRKFVSSVNGKALGVSREPIPDVTKLANGTATTATYNQSKTPVPVKKGDIVTYTIRVYNEGQLDGYASEITDHLPQQLEFLPDDEENIANGWAYDENDVTLRTIKTNHLSKNIDEGNIIKAFNGITLDYVDVTVKCKVRETVTSGEKITNIADITGFTDKSGKTVTDRDSQSNNVVLPDDENLPSYKDDEIESGKSYIPGQQDDDDFEKLQLQVFDLALRKFITGVNTEAVTNRVPVPTMGEDGNIKYVHTKDPVKVQTSDIVTYTLRIYNEGDIAGYASEITDNLPEGLLYLPENAINKTYLWKMIDAEGKETQDVTKAVKITTDYLSKENEKTAGENLIKAFDKNAGLTDTNPDYRDVKVAFKVIEPATSDRILTNTAEISDDTDKDGNPIDDNDSIPGNNDMTEDDIDQEHVKLEYFDLALRKFITKVDNSDIDSRYPQLSIDENGNIKYTHTKEPVEVENGNIVIYTLRIYNEGSMSGYASEITDNLPEGLLYLPENATNKTYAWKMIDAAGKETQDVTKAVKITTNYLSKENEKTAGENLIKAFDKKAGLTDTNPDYKDVKVAFKVTEPNSSNRILINTAEISDDTDENGKPVTDIDSTPGNNKDGEDDIDIEKVKLKYFDLALRKFITKVDNLDINNRYPKLSIDENGNIKYTHTKEPVEVENGNIVTYTLRVYNEGEVAGYASEITDDLPEGLVYLPENETNKTYSWKMIDAEGKETQDVTKAVKITTDYLSKENEKTAGENLIKAFDKSAGLTDTNPDYKDVKVAFKVTEPNTSDRILINTAEISDDTDKDGNPVEDIDSTPGNNKEGEDDIDIDKVKVKYFDLALKKWVTQAIVIENGKQTVTNTGHTGDENPEPVVKVDLKSKNINKVTVKFAYKIKVTNEGQIEGYVKELKDYIPEGLKFVQEDNPYWKEVSSGVVATTKLENTLLKPGESATVDIILTWINGNDNLGKKVNVAEISKDYNKSNTPDIDSTPDNKKPGEDDIDEAPVILSVKTGEEPKYIALTTIILVTLAGGVYLIKKYVL